MARKAWLLLNCMTLSAAALVPLTVPVLAQEAGVNGTNVARVEFNQGSVIQKAAANVWVEYDPAGNAINRYEERSRDEWTVYLYDPSRNLRLAVDLHRRELIIVGDNGDTPIMGTITGASVTPRTAARQPAPQPQPFPQPQQATTVAQTPRAPTQPAFTAPADPADDADYDPYAAPEQVAPVQQPVVKSQPVTTTQPLRTDREIITAAAQRPLFTQGGDSSSDASSDEAVSTVATFDGPWVTNDNNFVERGNGVTEAVTWDAPEIVWVHTNPDGTILIHFDRAPDASVMLSKVAEGQYSGGGYSARFEVLEPTAIRLLVEGPGTRKIFAAATVRSRARLSRDRFNPASREEASTFTTGATVSAFSDMLYGFRSEKMDLFDSLRGRAQKVFRDPGAEDYSVESNLGSRRLPYGLAGDSKIKASSNQLESVITNAASFEKSMSLNFGASGSFRGVSSGWEATREESRGQERNQGVTKAFGLARVSNYVLYLDKANMDLGPFFRNDIIKLAQGQITAQQIIDTYGTHYANAIQYGGIGRNSRDVTTQEFKDWSKQSTSYKQQGGIDAGPAASIKANGGLTLADGKTSGATSMFARETWESVGGTGSMGSTGWTVTGDSVVPVRYDLRPLSELISPVFFGKEWSTAQRSALITARNQLDAGITRYLQSQPKPDDRMLGPIVYQLTFHALKCLDNGDDGKDPAELYGKITASVHGLEGYQDVPLFEADEDNMQSLPCDGSGELPINRTVLVAGNRNPAGAGQGSFVIRPSGLYENDPTVLVIDDPIMVFPVEQWTYMKDWNASTARTDLPGTVITNIPGAADGPDIRVKVSFQPIQ